MKEKTSSQKKDENMIKVSFASHIEMNHIGMSSIELKRNSKNFTEFTIKIYDSNPGKAKEEAIKIFKELNTKFPGE